MVSYMPSMFLFKYWTSTQHCSLLRIREQLCKCHPGCQTKVVFRNSHSIKIVCIAVENKLREVNSYNGQEPKCRGNCNSLSIYQSFGLTPCPSTKSLLPSLLSSGDLVTVLRLLRHACKEQARARNVLSIKSGEKNLVFIYLEAWFWFGVSFVKNNLGEYVSRTCWAPNLFTTTTTEFCSTTPSTFSHRSEKLSYWSLQGTIVFVSNFSKARIPHLGFVKGGQLYEA